MLSQSCLEEIMLTVLILSNLATVSGYPLKKKKKNEENTQNLNLLHVRKWVVPKEGNLLYKTSFASLYDISSLPRWLRGKEATCQCRRHRRREFNPWVRKIPWNRKLQSTPAFLPGEFHGQGSLAGYSPWRHKEQTWLSNWADMIHQSPPCQITWGASPCSLHPQVDSQQGQDVT